MAAPTLVGVGYLDGLGWYNVTLMDIDRIIDRSLFLPIGLLLAAVVLAVALIIAALFKLVVLDRIARVRGGRCGRAAGPVGAAAHRSGQ